MYKLFKPLYFKYGTILLSDNGIYYNGIHVFRTEN
jgi:hypothetical protein